MSRAIGLRRGASALALIAATWIGGPAAAQIAALPQAQASTPENPDDIIVTAQKREERLQDVPASITALTADKLEKASVRTLEDAARLTPGLTIGAFTPARTLIYIRGVGARNTGIGSDPSVVTYIDDVYVGRYSATLGLLADVERIEVLKGPQGLLYGRNAIGGVINVVTARPTREFDAYAEAGFGDYDMFQAKGYVSGPISERLRARLSVTHVQRDGYVRNLATGGTGFGLDTTIARGALEFDATDRTNVLARIEYTNDESPSFLGKNEGPGQFLRSPLVAPLTPGPDFYYDRWNLDPEYRREVVQANLRVEHNADAVTLTSISAYRYNKLRERFDNDGGLLNILDQDARERSDEWSQELRLSSNRNGGLTLGGRLEWLLGLYTYRDKPNRADILRFGTDSLPVFAVRLAGAPITQIENSSVLDATTTAFGAFAQGSFSLTDKLKLTAGARYSYDKKKGVLQGLTDTPGAPLIAADFAVPLKRSWDSVDVKVGLDYHLTDDVMAYGMFATGYKSGGFQWLTTDPNIAARIYDPERARYVEVGVKSRFGPVTFNVAAFYNDYRNLQVQRLIATAAGGSSSLIDNVASARIKGAEVEARWRVGPALLLEAGYAYLDAKARDYVVGGGLDFSDTRLARSPKHTLNAAADVGANVAGGWLGLRGDVFVTSSFYHEPGEAIQTSLNREDGYALANLRVYFDSEAWRLSAFVTNLFDKRYRTGHTFFPDTQTPFGIEPRQGIATPGAPRMYGFTIGRRFK
jgi:iron complex outermembrane receptor protein